MVRKFIGSVCGLAVVAIVLTMVTTSLSGQGTARNVEWRTYGADMASTRYSPLDQVNATNFSKLEVAWRFKTDNLGPRPEFNLQSTPLMVNGVLYSTAGTRRAVVALNPASGELRWVYSLDEGKRGEEAPRQLSGRGLGYWTDGREERIIYVTPGYMLIALDAKTGRPVSTFGTNGIVDLKKDDDQEMDLVTGSVGYHAAPIITGNTVIIGAAHLSGGIPKSKTNVKGYVRAFDVRTGKRLWIFHTIPRPGEFGNETWEKDSWSYTGNTGVWGQITVDEQLGIVYLPVEMPTGDYYGGHRPGDGLFGNSLVALDVKTGKRLWHYQFIHHDIWDWDIPCAPILADITVNGRLIKAVAQPTKQSWIYVFDRVTGQPVWPIEERPVPQTDVPGEQTAKTQPFPTKPPPFEAQGVTENDLIDFTPEIKAAALKVAAKYKLGPIFTPGVVSQANGPLAALMRPSSAANWMGGGLDPETNILYVYSSAEVKTLGLVHDPKQSDMDYIQGIAGQSGGGGGEGGGGVSVEGLPLTKPPWGRISAIDLNKGEIAWQIAHGETPDNVRNHPLLKGVTIPRTGRPGRIGLMVTKSLVVSGEGGYFTTPDGRRGAMLRGYDKSTGKEVGAVYMPAPQTGSPMTYSVNGRQYIIVSIGGGTYSAELLAFRLPAAS